MLIHVCSKHIKAGKRELGNLCPVALAIKEQAGVNGVLVGWNSIVAGYSNIKYHCPRNVKNFVRDFDFKGKKFVKPFSFILKEIL